MEFHGTIQSGKITFPIPVEELWVRFLASMKDGTLVRIDVVKSEADKTHSQIKTIFGLAIATIKDQFDERGWDSSILLGGSVPTGVPVSKILIKEYLYVVCPICDDSGNRITLSQASISQAAKFFEDVRNHSASQWSIIIPEPRKDWKENKNGLKSN